jgi:streptogramin lyase
LPDGVGELSDGYATGVNSPVVRRLDPDTGQVVGEVRMPHDELVMSLAGGWAIGNCGSVVRLADRLTVRVADVSQDLPAVAAAGSLWVGDEVRSEIVRVDAATGQVVARMPFAASDPDDPAFFLVAGKSTVWVLDHGVSKVDIAANRVTRVTNLPGVASAVAY